MPKTIRRMPVRTADVELAGDYEGWVATMRTNPPWRVFEQLSSGDFAQMREALEGIIQSWNFVDENGEPIPAPRDGGIAAVPVDLITLLVERYMESVNRSAEVPKA